MKDSNKCSGLLPSHPVTTHEAITSLRPPSNPILIQNTSGIESHSQVLPQQSQGDQASNSLWQKYGVPAIFLVNKF